MFSAHSQLLNCSIYLSLDLLQNKAPNIAALVMEYSNTNPNSNHDAGPYTDSNTKPNSKPNHRLSNESLPLQCENPCFATWPLSLPVEVLYLCRAALL